MIYTGVVENRMDPLKLGRCQVRIHGLHTHNKSTLPTSDLPWAYPLQSIDSAAISGIGRAPVGVVEGTVVMLVFRDQDQQQPIMIGSIGGIPQEEGRVDTDQPPLMFNESSPTTPAAEVPVTSPTGESILQSNDGTAVTTSDGTPVTTTSSIPGTDFGPREGSNVKIDGKCFQGINAVAAAMDSMGITETYARAAILGIIGGECDWVPQKEAYGYSRSRIKEVFTWMSDADADTYSSWKGSREDFFRFVYGPTTRSGKNLGNKDPEDGAKYYGRGFIQLTGAYNYARYAKLSGVDILGNPDLINDYTQGAQVAVAYFKDRVKLAQNDPGYFDAACSAVGFNVPNIKAKKQAYYKYFLLGDEKASKVPQEVLTNAVVGSQPTTVKTAPTGLPLDRQQHIVLGFRDPNMKYPLRELINEPDTNRLARGRVEGTSVQTRDNTRVTDVPTADRGEWNQPPIPYNSKYPFNRMFASESGHLQEFDDTPDNERINWMHRSGTFTEVDSNGTQVNRIIGDGYEIVDRNGYVYVRGAYNITSEGFTTILVNADAHIRVAGHTQLDFEQDVDMNISRDFNLNVGGNWITTVGGKQDTVVVGNRTTNILAQEVLKVASTRVVEIIGNDSLKVGAARVTQTIGDDSLKVGGSYKIGVSSSIGIGAGSGIAIDGSTINLNSGGSVSIGGLDSPDALTYPTVPEIGVPLNNRYDILTTPSRNFEIDTSFETPEEISTPSGTKFHEEREIIGEKTDPNKTSFQDTIEIPSAPSVATAANCDLIMNMDSFPLSLRLSDNFTLGDLIRDPKHVIADQMLQDTRTAPARKYTKQEIVCNLKGVALNILEKVVELVPGGKSGFSITSGYRFAGLTANESKVSDHPKGNAVDIVLSGKNFDYKAHYDLAQQLANVLPYHQIILEYRDPGRPGNNRDKRIIWIHIAHRYEGAQKQAFTMLNDKTYNSGFSLLA